MESTNSKLILCSSIFFDHDEAQVYLRNELELGYEVVFLNLRNSPIEEDLPDNHPIRKCEILIVDHFQAPLFVPYLSQSQINWIHCTTAGVNLLMENQLFKDYLTSTDQRPWITRTSYSKSMVVYCLAHICSMQHGLNHYQELQKQHIWKKDVKTRPLTTKTVGFLGVGDVGSEIAGVCKQLGLTCIGLSISTDSLEPFDAIHPGDLNSVLEQSDFLINSLPETPQTINMLSNGRLKPAEKKSPVFINVGRGSIIDEESILEALDLGWISHAILNVAPKEPLGPESKLWDHSKVTVTPHIAGGSVLTEIHPFITEVFITNIKLAKEEKEMKRVVSYEKGY